MCKSMFPSTREVVNSAFYNRHNLLSADGVIISVFMFIYFMYVWAVTSRDSQPSGKRCPTLAVRTCMTRVVDVRAILSQKGKAIGNCVLVTQVFLFERFQLNSPHFRSEL